MGWPREGRRRRSDSAECWRRATIMGTAWVPAAGCADPRLVVRRTAAAHTPVGGRGEAHRCRGSLSTSAARGASGRFTFVRNVAQRSAERGCVASVVGLPPHGTRGKPRADDRAVAPRPLFRAPAPIRAAASGRRKGMASGSDGDSPDCLGASPCDGGPRELLGCVGGPLAGAGASGMARARPVLAGGTRRVNAGPPREAHVMQTELWIDEARTFLNAARRGRRDRLAETLGDHLSRIDITQAQTDLGCGEYCATCSWGVLGGHALPCEPCRLLAFREAVEDLRRRSGDAVAVRREAAALLKLLDSLPPTRSR